MKCRKCGKKLTGKQTSYCSPRCSKLHLKSLYRKRNKEKINDYNRKYRKKQNALTGKYRFSKGSCYFCGSKKNLHRHHLDYKNDIVVDLCMECHRKYHKLEECIK